MHTANFILKRRLSPMYDYFYRKRKQLSMGIAPYGPAGRPTLVVNFRHYAWMLGEGL